MQEQVLPQLKEQKQAELEFERQIQRQKSQRQDEIQTLRRLAKLRQIRYLERKTFKHWQQFTKSRTLGPFRIPAKPLDLRHLIDTHDLRATPIGAVAAFLLAVLRRSQNPHNAMDLLSLTLHPQCLVPESFHHGSTTGSNLVRPYFMKKLQRATPDAIASFVVGATPENAYAHGSEVSFLFDQTMYRNRLHHQMLMLEQLRSTRNKASNIANGHISQASLNRLANNNQARIGELAENQEVFVSTSGALELHPTARKIGVKKHGTGWYVRDFDRFFESVVSPINSVPDMDEPNHTPLPEKQIHGYDTLRIPKCRGREREALCSVVNREGTGKTNIAEPINFSEVRRKLKAEKLEATNLARRNRAVGAVSDLAQLQAENEMYNRWSDSPNVTRRLISGNGNETIVKLSHTEILKKKSQLRTKLATFNSKLKGDLDHERSNSTTETNNHNTIPSSSTIKNRLKNTALSVPSIPKSQPMEDIALNTVHAKLKLPSLSTHPHLAPTQSISSCA